MGRYGRARSGKTHHCCRCVAVEAGDGRVDSGRALGRLAAVEREGERRGRGEGERVWRGKVMPGSEGGRNKRAETEAGNKRRARGGDARWNGGLGHTGRRAGRAAAA